MPSRPNICLVLCDQMRRQAMSCAGDPNVSTPNLDRLADEGVRFTNANSTYPICVPTRFTLVTGEHAHTRQAHHRWRMSPAERTFAHELEAAGYRTAYVGHWYLANLQANLPVARQDRGGFSYWRGFDNHRGEDTLFETKYYADDDPNPRSFDAYHTDGLFDLGFEFLDDHETDDRPFCLVISVVPPHPPYSPPDSYRERWTDRSLELRPNVPFDDPDALPDMYSEWGSREAASDDLFVDHSYHGERLLDDLRGYYGMIENLDDNVGRLLEELEARGLRSETAMLFTSDHGDMHGSHGLAMKQQPYEESVGVPLIISHPGGGIDSGAEIDVPTCTEDWYPTILGFAGLEADDKPGIDVLSLVRDGEPTPDRDGVLLEFVREIRPPSPYSDEKWRTFRTERYKYTVKGSRQEGGEPWQLFDLEADPYEQDNLVDDPAFADLARELHGQLRDALDRTGDYYTLRPAFGHDGRNLPEFRKGE